jgi:hypothetical protein
MSRIGPFGWTISCVGTMTPARYVGRGVGRRWRWVSYTLNWARISHGKDTTKSGGPCNALPASQVSTACAQSAALFKFAVSRGCEGELPPLFLRRRFRMESQLAVV